MTATYILISFLFGTIIGSFLNVVIYRYNTGRSVNGRSGCLSCGKKLGVIELLPIVSFLMQRGKCKGCGSRISWQYPLVELSTGVLFALIAYKILNSMFFYDVAGFLISFFVMALIVSLLVVIFVYDLKHKIIPDALVFTFIGLALLIRLLATDFAHMTTLSWFDLFAGIIFFIPFFLLWFCSKGQWIGLGDGKLALGIGWLLGFIHGLSAIIMAFWIGALFSIAFMLICRLKLGGPHITMKTEVPFAPFLILGILIIFLYPIDVFNLSLFFTLN